MNAKSWIVGIAMLAASIATASAQTLKDQLIGVWTLVSNIEKYQDGKEKSTFGPQGKGQLILDRTGSFCFSLLAAIVQSKLAALTIRLGRR